MWKHKFRKKEIKEDEIKKYIDEYISLKGEIGLKVDRVMQLQEIISQYMDSNAIEQVFSDQGRILRILRKAYKYDKEKLRAILEPLDKWEEVLKVDGIALKNTLGILPYEIRKEIEKAREVDKTSKSLVVKKS
jgi:hypothetical protein